MQVVFEGVGEVLVDEGEGGVGGDYLFQPYDVLRLHLLEDSIFDCVGSYLGFAEAGFMKLYLIGVGLVEAEWIFNFLCLTFHYINFLIQ